jgi:hypothetical protein
MGVASAKRDVDTDAAIRTEPGRGEASAMRAPSVRYRVRVRFTVRRLIAAVACFGLVLGLVHDAGSVDDWEKEIPWSLVAGALIFCLLSAAAIGVQIITLTQFLREYRIRRKRDPLSPRPKSELAARGEEIG